MTILDGVAGEGVRDICFCLFLFLLFVFFFFFFFFFFLLFFFVFFFLKQKKKKKKKKKSSFISLFVLRFYGPVNPMGSCQARSVYLTTRLLGRLSAVMCPLFL